MRWTLKPNPNPEKVKALQEALQVDQTVASLLIQRGIESYEDAKTFFRPSLEDLHDPFLMKDMDKAVLRIEEAISKRENILLQKCIHVVLLIFPTDPTERVFVQ